MSTTLRGGRLDQPEMPTGEIVLQAPPAARAARGRQRRADERDPDAGQPRLDRARRQHRRRRGRRSQLPRGGHVPVRHGRLHRRPDRPAAEAAHAAGDGVAHRVPAVPRQRPQGRPRGRRPAAPRADLAAPRPVGPAVAGRGTFPGLGAPLVRPALPARPLRPVRAAARPEPGGARDDRRRPGRPGRRVGPAPAPGRAPPAAEPARVDRPAGVRPHRGVRSRGRGALARAGDDLQRGGVPVAGEPRDRRARLRAEPRPLGLDEVAPPLPVHRAERRRRADADGVDVARRPGRAAAAGPQRAAAVRRGRAAGHPAPAVRRRRRVPAARQPRRTSRRPARRHGARPARALGRARRRVVPAAAVRGRRAGRRGPPPAERAAAARGPGARAGRPVRPGDGRGVRPPADPAAHGDRRRHRHPERRDRRADGLHGPARARRGPRLRPRRWRGGSGRPATGCACRSGSATAAT